MHSLILLEMLLVMLPHIAYGAPASHAILTVCVRVLKSTNGACQLQQPSLAFSHLHVAAQGINA